MKQSYVMIHVSCKHDYLSQNIEKKAIYGSSALTVSRHMIPQKTEKMCFLVDMSNDMSNVENHSFNSHLNKNNSKSRS